MPSECICVCVCVRHYICLTIFSAQFRFQIIFCWSLFYHIHFKSLKRISGNYFFAFTFIVIEFSDSLWQRIFFDQMSSIWLLLPFSIVFFFCRSISFIPLSPSLSLTEISFNLTVLRVDNRKISKRTFAIDYGVYRQNEKKEKKTIDFRQWIEF